MGMWLMVTGLLVLLVLVLESRKLQEERSCRAPMQHVNFLTDVECRGVIDAATKRGLTRSEVGDGEGQVSKVRTSHQVFLPHHISAVEPVIVKAEKLLGCSRKHFEQLQVVRYTAGQKYEAHFDSDDDTPPENRRTDTLLMYLNDPTAGGQTEFPKVGIEVDPEKGKAVHWKNLDSHGHLLPCAFHGGRPVTKGVKWICTVWKRL